MEQKESVAPQPKAALQPVHVMWGKAAAPWMTTAGETSTAEWMQFAAPQLMDARPSAPVMLENLAVAKMTNAEET